MENPEFLKKKYDLHNAPEVERAAKRTEVRTGKKVPQNPEARIHYRLKYTDQPLGEGIYIGMKQIAACNGNPNVSELERRESGL